jgi:hypothetical protein
MVVVDGELLADGDDDKGSSSSRHCSHRLELEGVATPSAEDSGVVHRLERRRWWPATTSKCGRQWRVEQSGVCVRRKGNGRGSPLATPTRRDKTLDHVGRWRQPTTADVAALTARWRGDQAVAHTHRSE